MLRDDEWSPSEISSEHDLLSQFDARSGPGALPIPGLESILGDPGKSLEAAAGAGMPVPPAPGVLSMPVPTHMFAPPSHPMAAALLHAGNAGGPLGGHLPPGAAHPYAHPGVRMVAAGGVPTGALPPPPALPPMAAVAAHQQQQHMQEHMQEHTQEQQQQQQNRKRKLTPEEKQQQNRDRNREHARNTRLRKKAYVDKLKTLVDSFTAQTDAHDREARLQSMRAAERTRVRRDVIHSLLTMRASGETNRFKWCVILDPGFVFVLPASPDGEQAVASRPNTRGSFQGLKRELGDAKPAGGELLAPQEFRGIDAVINEATSCARLFAGEPSVEFALSEDDVIMSGDKLMCRWELLLHELKAPGMLYATFTPQNKLLSAEMVFDSLAIAKQLQQRHSLRATGGVAPPQKSAVQSAEMRGELMGGMAGGVDVERETMAGLMSEISNGHSAALIVDQPKDDDAPASSQSVLRVYPINSEEGASNFLGVLEPLPGCETQTDGRYHGDSALADQRSEDTNSETTGKISPNMCDVVSASSSSCAPDSSDTSSEEGKQDCLPDFE